VHSPWHCFSVAIEVDIQSGGLELVRMMGFPCDFEPQEMTIVESVASVRFDTCPFQVPGKQDSVVASCSLYMAANKQASE